MTRPGPTTSKRPARPDGSSSKTSPAPPSAHRSAGTGRCSWPAPLVGQNDVLNGAGPQAARDREAAVNRHNRQVDEDEIRKSRRFDSQSFASGGDFASFAIQKALSDPDDDVKKQLQELQKNGISLDELTKLGNEFISLVKTAPPLRAILRGSS